MEFLSAPVLESGTAGRSFFQQSAAFVKDLEDLPDPSQDKELEKVVSRRRSI